MQVGKKLVKCCNLFNMLLSEHICCSCVVSAWKKLVQYGNLSSEGITVHAENFPHLLCPVYLIVKLHLLLVGHSFL